MRRPLPAAPSDLGSDGRALWRRIHEWLRDVGLALDPHETPLVAELARTVDRLAAARGALATIHPADPAWTRVAGEERQQRLAYARVVSALGLPSGVVPDAADVGAKVVGLSPRSRRAQKAARARWGSAGGS
jgi:hypothetical protein